MIWQKRLLLLAVGFIVPVSLSKIEFDFSAHQMKENVKTIKCYVCSPCNSTYGDAWDVPILAECLPGENYCFTETHTDGTLFLSCSDECENGTFTEEGRTFKVECCSGRDGCNKLPESDTDPPPPPVKRQTPPPKLVSLFARNTTSRFLTTTSSPVVATTKPITSQTTANRTELISTTLSVTNLTTATQVTPSTSTATAPKVIDFSVKARKCFVCDACNGTVKAELTLCQPSAKFCYKELRADETIMQSCANECPHVSGAPSNLAAVTMSECCSDSDGCNGHLGDSYEQVSTSPSKSSATSIINTAKSFIIVLILLEVFLHL